MRQRIYELRKVIYNQSSRGALRLATEDDIDSVAPWILAFEKEALMAEGDLSDARENAISKINSGDLYYFVEIL